MTLTAQQVFDKVATHAHTQGVCAEDDEGQCRYRHPDGLQCFAGCLITDDEYKPEMEGQDFNYLVQNFPSMERFAEHAALIMDLQKIHDQQEPDHWPDELSALRHRHPVDTSIVSDLWGET